MYLGASYIEVTPCLRTARSPPFRKFVLPLCDLKRLLTFSLNTLLATSRWKVFHILTAFWPYDAASHICPIDTSGFLSGVHLQALNFYYYESTFQRVLTSMFTESCVLRIRVPHDMDTTWHGYLDNDIAYCEGNICRRRIPSSRRCQWLRLTNSILNKHNLIKRQTASQWQVHSLATRSEDGGGNL